MNTICFTYNNLAKWNTRVEIEEQNVFVFDTSEEQRTTTQKCIEYLWAGRIFSTGDLSELQQAVINSTTEDVLALSLASFERVDVASWLLGTGFKGRLILILNQENEVPEFLPCEVAATVHLPVKLSDFNQVFNQHRKVVTERHINQEKIAKLLSHRECLSLEFQPEFYAKNEKLSGFECLVRFQENGIKLSTKEVLNAIEKHQMIEQFSEVFFKRVAEILPAFSSVRLSLNLSLIDLEQYDLLAVIAQHFDISGINSNKIIFEFPLDAFYSSNRNVINLLTGLKENGFCLGIDGNEQLLDRLGKLPLVIDTIKVPASRLADLSQQQHEKLSQFYHNHDVELVFVKIESYQAQKRVQNNFLLSHMQGYYLAPPIPIQQVFEMLKGI